MMDAKTARIRHLNDQARTSFRDCRVFISNGIQALGDAGAVLRKVQSFDAFTPNNDPHGEHDFGAIEHAGRTIFWKIDYYDLDLCMMSLDPSEQDITTRVLTVMMAEEY